MPGRIGIPLEDWRERALKSWSTVIAHNTHNVQTHIIFDKEGYGVVIPAGQRREIAMLDEDIVSLREQRRPGRLRANAEGDMFTCPQHPVVIEDIPALPPANVAAAEEARQPIK
jgi:hypothetical protein